MIPKVGTAGDLYAVDALVTAVEAATGRNKRLGFEMIIETALGLRQRARDRRPPRRGCRR